MPLCAWHTEDISSLQLPPVGPGSLAWTRKVHICVSKSYLKWRLLSYMTQQVGLKLSFFFQLRDQNKTDVSLIIFLKDLLKMLCVQDVYKHTNKRRLHRRWKDTERKHKHKHSRSKIRGQNAHKGDFRIYNNKFSFPHSHSSSVEYFT